MRCKFCDSQEELAWPVNYVKGNRPINIETRKVHECDDIMRYNCPGCGVKIMQFKGDRDLCSVCQLERFKN